MANIPLSDGEWRLMNQLWGQSPATITQLTERLANEKLSVRETEALARLMAGREAQKDNPVHRAPTPKAFKKAARGLRETLGTNVRVKTVQGKNKIEIEFADENDLERIFGLIIH